MNHKSYILLGIFVLTICVSVACVDLFKMNVSAAEAGEIADTSNESVEEGAFEVYTVQKTGDDSEKAVWVFMGEGYTEKEQDKYIEDVTKIVKTMLETDPFSRYADEFNIYAIKVISNESGVGRYADAGAIGGVEVDNYFGTKLNYRGVERAPGYSAMGGNRLRSLLLEFAEDFMDQGGSIMEPCVLINSTEFAGTGGAISLASLGADGRVVIHEAVHTFAKLGDEYFDTQTSFVSEDANKTTNGNPESIKWREFLGFRGIGIYPIGVINGTTTTYKPSKMCMMQACRVCPWFCEVCKLQIATVLNDRIKNKKDLYVADPITTIATEGEGYESGRAITAARIKGAIGKKVEFRTVVKNFTDSRKTITLEFAVIDKDGKEKYKISEDFVLAPDELKSLEIVTGQLEDLNLEDTFAGKVVDADRQMELANLESEGASFGTLHIKYCLGNEAAETDIALEEIGEQVTPYKLPGEYTLTPPPLRDYVYVKSSIKDNVVEIQRDKQEEVVYYYARKEGTVTLQLVDADGTTIIEEQEWRVGYGDTFTPSKSDFPAREGYYIRLPKRTAFDGINDMTITYQYRENWWIAVYLGAGLALTACIAGICIVVLKVRRHKHAL